MSKKKEKSISRKIPEKKSSAIEISPARIADKMTLYLAVIIVLSFITFSPSLNNAFVNWDDYAYIVENPIIKELSWRNIEVIFNTQTYVVGNYHPLTVLTYVLEFKLVGLNPWLYHFDNILLHLLNIVLIFLITQKLFQNNTITLVSTFLFALHPLRVESVSWAAERKDVLYTFFFLLSLISYLWFTDKKKWILYSIALLSFILSILSKGQAVVLPMVLLLIDYFKNRSINWKIILEKIPFFAFSILFGIIAMKAQHSSLTAERLTEYSWLERILFVSYGLMMYLYKLVLPLKLSCLYIYPKKVEGFYPLIIYIAPLVILGLAYLIYRFKKNKILVFSSLFYLFTISIVLQVLPVGDAIIAERYTYIPYIGLFFLAGYFVKYFFEKFPEKKIIIISILIFYAIFFPIKTFSRTMDWKNSETLWESVMKNFPETAVAYNNHGVAIMERDPDKAFKEFSKAIELKPDYFESYNNRGTVYGRKKDYVNEIAEYSKAVAIAPAYITGYFNRGLAYANNKEYENAIKDYETVIKAEPRNSKAWYSKGLAYKNLGKDSLAIESYKKAISLFPAYDEALNNLGNIYFNLKQYDEALINYNTAIQINPKNGNAYLNRSAAYYEKKDFQQALADALKSREVGYTVDEQYIQFLKSNIR